MRQKTAHMGNPGLLGVFAVLACIRPPSCPLRRVTSVLPAGGKNTIWKLGFRQSSFHRIARALRNQSYNALGL